MADYTYDEWGKLVVKAVSKYGDNVAKGTKTVIKGVSKYGDNVAKGTKTVIEGGLDDVATKAKPYTNSRPSYGKGQVDEVWNNAKDPITGKVYDPTGVEIKWDPTKPRPFQSMEITLQRALRLPLRAFQSMEIM